MITLLPLAFAFLAFPGGKLADPRFHSLHELVWDHDLAGLRKKIDSGANLEAVENSYSRRRALHVAAEVGDLEAARMLLDAGARPDARLRSGWTALLLACECGHAPLVEELLDRGLSPDGAPSAAGAPSESPPPAPILVAASAGKLEVVRLLLGRGARADADDELGWTALHHAAAEGHADVAAYLLEDEKRSTLLLEASDSCGWRPIHVAAAHGRAVVLELLLSRGSSSDARSSAGFTPLHLAEMAGEEQVCTRLRMEEPSGGERLLGAGSGRSAHELQPFPSRAQTKSLEEPALVLAEHGGYPGPVPSPSGLLLAVWLDGTLLFAPDFEHPGEDLLVAQIAGADVLELLHLLSESGWTRMCGYSDVPMHSSCLSLRFDRSGKRAQHAWAGYGRELPGSTDWRFLWRRFVRGRDLARRVFATVLPKIGSSPPERQRGSPFRGYRFDDPWQTPWM